MIVSYVAEDFSPPNLYRANLMALARLATAAFFFKATPWKIKILYNSLTQVRPEFRRNGSPDKGFTNMPSFPYLELCQKPQFFPFLSCHWLSVPIEDPVVKK